jgi:hypothetical protein
MSAPEKRHQSWLVALLARSNETKRTATSRISVPHRRATALDGNGQKIGLSMPWWFWNFFGQQAVFLLRR